jgi:hypothetical protein
MRDYFFIVPPGVVASPFLSADPGVPALGSEAMSLRGQLI